MNRPLSEERTSVRKQAQHRDEPELKGTFASVMMLGGFLIVSWLLVFAIYLIRN